MYPMKMIPVFKDYLWGGERLANEYGKNTNVHPVAESWEVSCHNDGKSRVANGAFAGCTLADVLRRHPHMLGNACEPDAQLPVLIKLIDAAQSTSLQVHPPDAYARAHEGQAGKNEMWYVLDAQPGTSLIMGCKDVLSREELKQRIENNTVTEIVNAVPVKAGDCYLIPAGMFHTIGGGALLAEIQQSSNVTYRLYDYDRRDAAGNLRTLHIEKALDVTDTGLRAQNLTEATSFKQHLGYRSAPLATWKWFVTELIEIDNYAALASFINSFSALLVTEGELCLEWDKSALLLHKGESVFIPAGMGEYILIGTGKLLLTHL